MKIVVLVKTATGAAVGREDAFWRSGRVLPGVLGPINAHGVEVAVRLRERGVASEVAVIAMASSSEVLGGVREALAMGADRATLLGDPEIEALDLAARSRILAALIQREAADLHLFCPWPGDIDGTLLWGMTAARLGLPCLAQARSLEIDPCEATIVRQVEDGDAVMRASLPCFVDVAEAINKARHPTMKAIAAARSRPLDIIRLADLNISASAATFVRDIAPVARSRETVTLDDPSTAPERLLELLDARGVFA